LAEQRIQGVLENGALVESLKIEQRCEVLEVGMARMLLPFAEFARCVDGKKGRLCYVEDVCEVEDVPYLRELMRRLKLVLTRKPGAETSTGIRPLLVDLQGIPRDASLSTTEIFPFGDDKNKNNRKDDDFTAVQNRLTNLVTQLKTLHKLGKTKGGFQDDKKDIDIPYSTLRSCANFDDELFTAQYLDWYTLVKKQRELSQSCHGFEELAETMRQAEIEMSIAMAPHASLANVKQRLENYEKDRMKRFEVLKEVLRDVCLREMDLAIVLKVPDKDLVLDLPRTNCLGLFGVKLLMEGETLPLG